MVVIYRPIALLSVFSKVIEKASRIVSFLTANNLFADGQHGFRAGKSTTTALLQILRHIYEHLDKSDKVETVFLDLSKAFDCVRHDILLKKLDIFGLRGKCSSLISPYLSGKDQYVQHGGVFSNRRVVTMGVPQGNVLRPILFLIYCNDFGEFVSTFYTAYADDITLVSSCGNQGAMMAALVNNVEAAHKYFSRSALTVNPDKTYTMQFHPTGALYTSSNPVRLGNKQRG